MRTCRAEDAQIKGFTLTEILIVVALLGIMAGFGLTNFQKTVEKGYERLGIQQLVAMHGAEELYKARNGRYWPNPAETAVCGGNCGVQYVNPALNLNIQNDSNMSYCCFGDGTTYICYANRIAVPNWVLSIVPGTVTPPTNPKCDSGTCPSL